MKYSFNFMQVANWVYVIRNKLKEFRARLDTEKINKQEAIKILKLQKKHLLLVKDVINKKTKLVGIQKDFIKNFNKIKEEFGIKQE